MSTYIFWISLFCLFLVRVRPQKRFYVRFAEVKPQTFFSSHLIHIMFLKSFLLIDFRGREREREERLTRRSTYPCIHWLPPTCTLTRVQTCNPGASGLSSNQATQPGLIPIIFCSSHIIHIVVYLLAHITGMTQLLGLQLIHLLLDPPFSLLTPESRVCLTL